MSHQPRSIAIRYLLSSLAVVTINGCTWFATDVQRGYQEKGRWVDEQPRVYTTADVRVITHHKHPQTGQDVTCTEPTPDVAKALSTASSISLKGSSKAGASGEAAFAGGSAEAVAELAGRSTALIALRDGLFRTCEAYGNGAIGSDAYALVLSRYGQLMTTLFLGEDIRSAAALSNPAPVQSPALINITPSTAVQVQKSAGDTTAPAASDQQSKKAASVTKSSTRVSNEVGFIRIVNKQPQQGAPSTQKTAEATGSASASGNKKKATTTPAAPADPAPTTAAAPAAPENPTNSGGVSTAAVALVRMNEDYFDLNMNFLHQLVVACVNEYDPTRVRLSSAGQQRQSASSSDAGASTVPSLAQSVASGENSYLRQVCPSLIKVNDMLEAQKALATIQSTSGHPAPNVQPDRGSAAKSASSELAQLQ